MLHLLAEWKNNSNSLQVTNMPSIIRGKCFHYPVQDNEQLNVLNGDTEHKTSTFIPNLRQWKDISNTTIINKVDTLACFTRIRNYIWVTGGLGTCGNQTFEIDSKHCICKIIIRQNKRYHWNSPILSLEYEQKEMDSRTRIEQILSFCKGYLNYHLS